MADKTIAEMVQDLDLLRPKPEYVRLGGNDIDISFIPSGVAVDIMALQDRIAELSGDPDKMARVREGKKEALEVFDLSAELCAKITSCQYPEMTKEWLLKHTSVAQLRVLVDRVTKAVFRSLDTVEDESIKKEQPAEGSQ